MGVDAMRKDELNTWKFDYNYAQVSNDGVDTQKFALINLDYDRQFEEGSPWSYFAGVSFLTDAFRDFDFRLNVFNGLGYKWIDTDQTLLRTRAGAGVSREFGGADDDWKPELVLGLDLNRTLTETQKCGIKLDYFPSFADFQNDYRLVADLFWEMQLKQPNFFLRLSAIDYYDSTPGPAEPNDLFYALQLLWKLK